MKTLKIMYLSIFMMSGCYASDHNKMESVENGLRHSIIIAGDESYKMSLEDRMRFYKVQAVSIAMIDGGQIVWSNAYQGISPDGKAAQHIDTQTLFQAASVSKPVTAMGALLLVQQGKLSLDEDMNTYLKSWKIPENEFTVTEKVTLRRLLSHTAGTSVHGFAGYDADDCVPTTIEVLEGQKPDTKHVNSDAVRVTDVPGAKHCYSGGGTTIVQLLIEDVTGENFSTWMKHNILIPFGMTSSSFDQPLSEADASHAASGYYQDGKSVVHVYPEKAAAGLWTTPTDLASFGLQILHTLNGVQEGPLNRDLVEQAVAIQHVTGSDSGVGLGFFITGSGESMSFGHDGQNEGFISTFAMYPRLNKGYVVMINNDSAGGLMKEIGKSIADVYGIPGKEPLIKNAIQLDEASAQAYAGTYVDQDGLSLTIAYHDHNFFLTQAPFLSDQIQLYYAGENQFFAKELSFTFLFILSGDHVDSMEIVLKNGKKIKSSNGETVEAKKVS